MIRFFTHVTPSSLALLLVASACAKQPPTLPSTLPSPREVAQGFGERAGLVLVEDVFGDGAKQLVYLDQGWGPAQTLWYYHADQGSMLMPYALLINLEQADNVRRFIEPENLTRFRFLNQHATPNNPDALPIGFARHDDHMGLTCAACHTGQINYQGTAMRIDGAPAMADIIGFLRAVRAAIAATLADEAKLGRFTANMKVDAAAARKVLTETQTWLDSYEQANHPSVEEGFARLDAVTRIVNQTIRFTSDPSKSLAVGAPTSFPELWDAPRHDYVQWTGFATNAEIGPLGRNVGEVLGVYGRIDVQHYETEQAAKRGYVMSATAKEIVAMETALHELQSPRWPEDVLPSIDRELAERGEALYRDNCSSCHALLDRSDPRRKVVAMITGIDVVGTDPTAAKVVAYARVPAGKLEGAISPEGEIYGAEMGALEMLGDLVVRGLSTQPGAVLETLALAKLHQVEKSDKQGQHRQPTQAEPNADLLAYKARPLNGIWASAPYLHNGSVPSLYQLLLPAASRPTRFSVGRWEYDPREVGYVSDGELPFVVDTTLAGNGKDGHEYGTQLSDDERWALVEYLKTL